MNELEKTITGLRNKNDALTDAMVEASNKMTLAVISGMPEKLDEVFPYIQKLHAVILEVNQLFSKVMKENL